MYVNVFTEKANHGQPCVAKLPSYWDRGVVEVMQNRSERIHISSKSPDTSGLAETLSQVVQQLNYVSITTFFLSTVNQMEGGLHRFSG
jgi:hypothetical protein